MQKKYRIRKNGQFQYVYRKGKNTGAKEIALVYVRAGKLQVGFSVSKKVGNAVTRNKIKRRLKEMFRLQIPSLVNGFYVVVARPSATSATYQTLNKSLRYLLNKQGLYKKGSDQ